MRLVSVSRHESPFGGGRVRLVGEYLFGGAKESHETLWFDVAEEHAGDLSRSGNPWLLSLLPMAVTLGESLSICLPVDPLLREELEGLMQAWHTGYLHRDYQPIGIEADLLTASTPDPGGKTVAFFTGGVDSFFTVLRHQPTGDAIHRIVIDELLSIWGFDIPLANRTAFDNLTVRNRSIADRLGHGVVTIATNLRESAWRLTHWGEVGQGPALGGIAMALEGRFSQVLLAASVEYELLLPYGTHPLLDPLMSTTRLGFRDDGGTTARIDKIAAVSQSEFAMANLRVCWEGKDDQNCGACEKCLRTLAVFEMLGVTERAVTFPAGAWSVDALAAIKLRNRSTLWSMNALAEHAKKQGYREIHRAARHSAMQFTIRNGISRLLGRGDRGIKAR